MASVEPLGPTRVVPEAEASADEPALAETTPLLPVPSSQAGFGIELAVLWVRSLQGDREARRDQARSEEQEMLRAGRHRVAELREQGQAAWRGEIARAVGGIGAGGLQIAGACSPAAGPRSGNDVAASSGAPTAAGAGTPPSAANGCTTDVAIASSEAAEDGGVAAAETAAEGVPDAADVARADLVRGGAETTTGTAAAEAVRSAASARAVDWRGVLTGGAKLFESTMNLWGGAYDHAAGEHLAAAEDSGLAKQIAERHAARSRDAETDAADDIARTIQLLDEMLTATNAAQSAAVFRG